VAPHELAPLSETACDLCGSAGPDVEPGYLRVVRQARRGLGSEAVSFRCLCCEACAHEAARIKALRFKVIAGMAVWLFLAPCCLSPLGLLVDPGGSKVMNALIILPALFFVAAGFVVGPLFLRIATRRRTEHLLGAEVNRRLFLAAGMRRWGLFTELLIVRVLPAGETSQPLWPDESC
jgi:hypothetical protein